jgi:hypothetical protein
MRCNQSGCGRVMIPNMRYARNLAVYCCTVFSCPSGAGHDRNVYLSHCWACESFIDSRVNRQRWGNYYLCLRCGSGPKPPTPFRQGTVCPNCGGDRLRPGMRQRDIRCDDCNHEIVLPPPHRMTGNNDVSSV